MDSVIDRLYCLMDKNCCMYGFDRNLKKPYDNLIRSLSDSLEGWQL